MQDDDDGDGCGRHKHQTATSVSMRHAAATEHHTPAVPQGEYLCHYATANEHNMHSSSCSRLKVKELPVQLPLGGILLHLN